MSKAGILAAIVLVVWLNVAAGQAVAPAFDVGQKVEVREGDEWSAATILKKEGRKYQIRYDDKSEEWVTADRVRAPGASAPAAAAATSGPAMKPAPPLAVNIGDQIEVKWGGTWRKANVMNQGNGWTLVNYTPGPFLEWVEPWRLRKIGSTKDVPNASVNTTLHKPEPPPTTPPGPMPVEDKKAGGEADAVELPIKEANVGNAKEWLLGTEQVKWALAPDPAPAVKGISPQPTLLKGAINVHDKISPLIFAGDSPWAGVMWTNVFERKIGALEKISLTGVAPSMLMQFPVPLAPLDFGADGATLLARSDRFGFGESGRLDIWAIDKPQPQHVLSFVPYGDKNHSSRDIKWGKFLSNDRVLTMNGEGRVICWDPKTAQAVWAADVANVMPALSGGRKQLAVVVEQSLIILDPLTGKTLASAELPIKPSSGVLSFRPDGKQIALATDGTLSVWDATTGAHVVDAPYDASVTTIDWPGDGYVLLGTTLIDLEQKMPLWQYAGARVTGTYGGRVWYISDSQRGSTPKPVLTSAVLPSENVKKAAKTAKPDEIWAAQPGTSLSVEAGSVPGDVQAKALESLKSKLTANGFKIADGQPIKCVASVEAGKPQEISYRRFGEPPWGGGTKVTATPQTLKVAFVDAEGKTLWQRQLVKTPPPMLILKKDQTIEQAVTEATKPDEHFFVNVVLPKFVPKAQYRNGLGTSEMGPRGVVDSKTQAAAR